MQPPARALDEFDKAFDALARPGLEGRRHRRVLHHGEHRAFAFVARRQQALHRHVAQPPRRDVGNAQQADVVVRVEQGLEVSQEIADLAPVEEALAANEVIAHAGLAQGGFQRAGLGVGAEEDRLVGPGRALSQPRIFDLLGDGPRLLLVVGKGVQRDLRAVALLGPELLAATADVVLDDRVGRVEDGVGGAVVLLELDDLGLREMLLHVEQVGDLRAAPAVDALVVIADDAEVAMLAGEGLDELELRGIGVLVFIHHHVTVFGAAGLQRLGMLFEEPEREQDQIVEIHGIASAQGGLVAGADVLGHRADAGIAEHRGALAAVSEAAEQARIAAGSVFSPLAEICARIFLTAPSCSDSS